MAAPEIRAIDQETAHAGGAHLGERYFLAVLYHGPMIAPTELGRKPLDIGASLRAGTMARVRPISQIR
jgi:hypothetical protein